MAITAILTTIVFSGFAQEKNRTSLKNSADQLQIDLQGLQNRTQTGVVAPSGSAPPAGNGLQVQTSSNRQYILFADMPGANASYWDTASSDQLIQTRTLANDLVVNSLQTDVGAATRLDIVFTGFRGDASIRPSSGCSGPNPACATTATIILKNIRLNLCYAVSVNKAGGVVTKKQLATGSSCT